MQLLKLTWRDQLLRRSITLLEFLGLEKQRLLEIVQWCYRVEFPRSHIILVRVQAQPTFILSCYQVIICVFMCISFSHSHILISTCTWSKNAPTVELAVKESGVATLSDHLCFSWCQSNKNMPGLAQMSIHRIILRPLYKVNSIVSYSSLYPVAIDQRL